MKIFKLFSKLFSIITVSLLMASQPVLAYDGEILFRDIPWGSTVNEVSSILEEDDPWINPLGRKNIDQIIGVDKSEEDMYDNEDIGINIDYMDSVEEVAGYPVSWVTCRFVYDPRSGEIERDADNAILYCANYSFALRRTDYSVDEIEEDLISKLTSIYGEPDDQKNSTGKTHVYFDSEFVHTYWYGENDTMLVLYKIKTPIQKYVDDENEYSDLKLYYVWTQGDELLENANSLLNELDDQIIRDADAAVKANKEGL